MFNICKKYSILFTTLSWALFRKYKPITHIAGRHSRPVTPILTQTSSEVSPQRLFPNFDPCFHSLILPRSELYYLNASQTSMTQQFSAKLFFSKELSYTHHHTHSWFPLSQIRPTFQVSMYEKCLVRALSL